MASARELLTRLERDFQVYGDREEFWEFFASSQMAEGMLGISTLARVTPDPLLRTQLLELIKELRAELRVLAVKTAKDADRLIGEVLEAEQVRPDTNKDHHLKDNIKSMPYPGAASLGAVGIASIEVLDRTVNPRGGSDRPYWIVIEEGSDIHQPQLRGRRLFGKFFGPSGSSRPSPSRFRQDSSFIFSKDAQFPGQGSGGGFGVVENAIKGQHFLGRGSDAAWGEYVGAIAAIDSRYSVRLAALVNAAAGRVTQAAREAELLAAARFRRF
jgi:hypothetical protein